MKKSQIDKMISQEKARAAVSRDLQPRQVIATAGKLQVSFLKGNQNGKATN